MSAVPLQRTTAGVGVDGDTAAMMRDLGQRARAAAREIARASTAVKNNALLKFAEIIEAESAAILSANADDVQAARAAGLEDALVERLELNPARVKSMANGVREVAALPDPIGEMFDLKLRPAGFQVGRMRVPLGVVGIIYESRPNVTADAAALCLKSGNAAVLRGGSEALHANHAIAACLSKALVDAGLPADVVQVVPTADRTAVGAMLAMPEYIDVIIPRGGKSLVARVSAEARMPVIKHLDGNCHVYVDEAADEHKALVVAVNAKTQRYGTCNTMETLLVHAAIAPTFLPRVAMRYAEHGVELRGCARTHAILPEAALATDADWDTEYLAPILAIKIVDGLDEAMAHIARHGSAHTDSIVTENYSRAIRFLREVDSASVMINASTRLADGFEYGLGAEIGISTDKFHARGPVGLEGLTSVKWVVLGDGHVR